MEHTFSTLLAACHDKKAYKSFSELNVGEYEIKKFALVETKFGLKVQVFIEDFYVFLPTRFTNRINTQKQIDDLNKIPSKMIYNGRDKYGINLSFNRIVHNDNSM